jgi:hypothetical protein
MGQRSKLLVIFLFVCVSASAQAAPKAFAFPKPVNVIGARQDHLYPIGFSKNGKFAYLHYTKQGNVGENLWCLHILNLDTDKGADQLCWENFADRDYEREGDPLYLYRKYKKAFTRLLQKHHIHPVTISRLESVGQGSLGSAFSASLVCGRPMKDNNSIKTPIRVVVRVDKSGFKTVGRLQALDLDGAPAIWGHRIQGYIKNPFEDRLVLFVQYSVRGWEGPPANEMTKLFGVHLVRGFKTTR